MPPLRDRGVRPVIAHQTIGAHRPTAAERKLLGLKPGRPLLTMTQRAYDADGAAAGVRRPLLSIRPVRLRRHCPRPLTYTTTELIDGGPPFVHGRPAARCYWFCGKPRLSPPWLGSSQRR